jgi:hypothetical protein
MTQIFLAYQDSHRIYAGGSQRLRLTSPRLSHESDREDDKSDQNNPEAQRLRKVETEKNSETTRQRFNELNKRNSHVVKIHNPTMQSRSIVL